MKSILITAAFLFTSNLASVRTLFFKENTEKINTELYELTQFASLVSAPNLYAYNGLAIMRKAEYTINPYSKLSYFKKGKKKIEDAIKRNPNNPELRFIRLSVQTNIPSFLGYNGNIASDKKRVILSLKNQSFSSNYDFNKHVVEFLVNQDLISIQDKSALIKIYF